ncbi:hypothetical protein CDL15_Pgr010474 [Punica granatum]|uniref:Uncharacterized protein n=1 Tax=Punica granatum TaxID=22663 RepID=A0A218XWM8_PUNGR|nr:hypothetical protein CDL15_Pgr010474 [Punica granatum]
MQRQFVVVPAVTAASITTVPATTKVVAATTTLVATSASVSTAARGLGLVDDDALAVKILVVHPLDRIPYRLLIDEGDESEATRPLDLTIVDDP